MTTPPWKMITAEQYAAGWTEMRGVTPIHHDYILIAKRPDGRYVVRNPELQLLEESHTHHEGESQ